jgi:myo-inositol-1(or 4)-monophosphatase
LPLGLSGGCRGRYRYDAAMAAASTWAEELAFAIELARRAGQIIQAGYGNLERIEHKSRRDVVTDVDVRSEELLISEIQRRFPNDGILAEESGRHAGAGGDGRMAHDGDVAQDADAANDPNRGRTWVIDPLDGTVNYANGIPFYCVSIGLVADGHPVVGVVFDPARDDLYAASADGPAELDGTEVHASTKESLGDYVVSMAIIGRGGIWRERRIARQVRISRRMGSSALALAYVASGRFDAMVQNGGLSVWDVAAAGLIAERAGATVSDLAGGPWWEIGRKSGAVTVVAAPQPQHRELLELITQVGTVQHARRP